MKSVPQIEVNFVKLFKLTYWIQQASNVQSKPTHSKLEKSTGSV